MSIPSPGREGPGTPGEGSTVGRLSEAALAVKRPDGFMGSRAFFYLLTSPDSCKRSDRPLPPGGGAPVGWVRNSLAAPGIPPYWRKGESYAAPEGRPPPGGDPAGSVNCLRCYRLR